MVFDCGLCVFLCCFHWGDVGFEHNTDSMSVLDLTPDPKSLCGEGRNGNFPPAIKFTFVLAKHTQEKPNVDSNGKKNANVIHGLFDEARMGETCRINNHVFIQVDA